MKHVILFFLSWWFSILVSTVQVAWAASAKAPKTPQILEVNGRVENQKIPPGGLVTKKTLIVDNLHWKLNANSTVKVKLDGKRMLTVYGPAEFEIPTVSWESRMFNEIILRKGVARLEVQENPFPVMIKSPLFEIVPVIGEMVLIYDPERAIAEAWMIKGEAVFGALNAEESAQLKDGQKVTFQGLLEEGEIAYDLLLQGKKIPKGKLMPIQLIRKDELERYSSAGEKKQRQLADRKNAITLKRSQDSKSKEICARPAGQFNQCSWKKKGYECFRSRCVADGQWKDVQKVDFSSCGAGQTPKVGACDY